MRPSRIACCLTSVLLAGCATPQAARMQLVEVRVQADDPAWDAPLECIASNPAGRWNFIAPGTVEVLGSMAPMEIRCRAPAGAMLEQSSTRSRATAATREAAGQGAAAGAKIGAGAGAVLGVAAAPVMGPALAIVLVAGAAARGAQAGEVAGAMTSGIHMEYPSPIVLRIHRAGPQVR